MAKTTRIEWILIGATLACACSASSRDDAQSAASAATSPACGAAAGDASAPSAPSTPTDPSAPSGDVRVGNATQFPGQGGAENGATGACGVPEGMMDSEDYVALNVQNTPHDYDSYLPRPIAPADAAKMGLFANGASCGRWIRVHLDGACDGLNDGARDQPFCRGGRGFVPDGATGATLDFVVSDSCQDGNAWCRDDPNHVDLHATSLAHFVKDGRPIDVSRAWTNDRVRWEFVPPPAYSGDVRIAFTKDASRDWPAIVISHLPNGIHAVEQQLDDGTWRRLGPSGDRGQVFELSPSDAFRIKIVDADEREIRGGREYDFALPAACAERCAAIFTEVRYTTRGGE